MVRLSILRSFVHGRNICTIWWISSYFTSRAQGVVVGGEKSSVLSVFSGVLQGSVLGPFLFIDGLHQLSFSSNCFLNSYAHDMLLYKALSSSSDMDVFVRDNALICAGIRDLHLTLNSAKCKFMVISESIALLHLCMAWYLR